MSGRCSTPAVACFRADESIPLLGVIASLALIGCSATQGQPLDPAGLGYSDCVAYYDCGQGRYCNADGYCWSDCRTTADCALLDDSAPELICNLFGQCVAPGGERECAAHDDCGENGLCNGRCSMSNAVCGQASECPYDDDGEECAGLCAPHCRTDDDCLPFDPELSCTPVSRCLLPGWERWISPGELPPADCQRDSQCKALGWSWECDCAKRIEPDTGLSRCASEDGGVCIPTEGPLDLGSGPESCPARTFRGVWGMRVNLAIITYGLPLHSRLPANSSHLFLVRVRQDGEDRLLLDEKLCELKMINFSDNDSEPSSLIHVTIPLRFLASIPLLTRTVELQAADPDAPWTTSTSLEVRGCLLPDPWHDPLPTRTDFEADPDDPRFWDQDEDGKPGMTTLTDGVLRGEIYIVQRVQLAAEGRIVDPDHVRGLIQVRTEEHIISSSKASMIYDIDTEIHPDPERTFFRMQRLPDDASCADLIRLADREDSWLRQTDFLTDVTEPFSPPP